MRLRELQIFSRKVCDALLISKGQYPEVGINNDIPVCGYCHLGYTPVLIEINRKKCREEGHPDFKVLLHEIFHLWADVNNLKLPAKAEEKVANLVEDLLFILCTSRSKKYQKYIIQKTLQRIRF